MDRRGNLTIWVAIEDVEPDMAPVEYLPGSHRIGSVGRRVEYGKTRPPPGERGRMPEGYEHLLRPDDYRIVGEPVAHDGMTLHGSYPNRSDWVRRSWVAMFFPADTQYTGLPRVETDGLGLEVFKPFAHPRFPQVC